MLLTDGWTQQLWRESTAKNQDSGDNEMLFPNNLTLTWQKQPTGITTLFITHIYSMIKVFTLRKLHHTRVASDPSHRNYLMAQWALTVFSLDLSQSKSLASINYSYRKFSKLYKKGMMFTLPYEKLFQTITNQMGSIVIENCNSPITTSYTTQQELTDSQWWHHNHNQQVC